MTAGLSREEYYEQAGYHNQRIDEDLEKWRTREGLFKHYDSNAFYYTVSKDSTYITKDNKTLNKKINKEPRYAGWNFNKCINENYTSYHDGDMDEFAFAQIQENKKRFYRAHSTFGKHFNLSTHKESNPILLTGRTSNVITFDFDISFEEVSRYIKLPKTPTVISQSGHFHLYFKYDGGELKTKTNVLQNTKFKDIPLDIKNNGGQVCLPSGYNPYQWMSNRSLEDCDVADIPDALLNIVKSDSSNVHPSMKELVAKARDTSIKSKYNDENINSDEDGRFKELYMLLPSAYYQKYNTWTKIGMSICNLFNGADTGLAFFKELQQIKHPQSYNALEMEKLYGAWSKPATGKKVTIGTIFYWLNKDLNMGDDVNQWRENFKSKPSKYKLSDDETKELEAMKIASRLPVMFKNKICELVGDEYKREYGSGRVYKKVKPYFYKMEYEDPQLFLNHIFKGNELFSRLSTGTSDELVRFIRKMPDDAFPFIEMDYDYIGFSNGIYHLRTATFTHEDDIDIESNIQVRTYEDIPFEEEKEAPLLDKYLNFQFEDKDGVINFIYFMVGRALLRIQDGFDFMLFLYGTGDSGKSVLLELIKRAYATNQISNLKSSFEERFGLSGVAKSQIFVSDDMPQNVAKAFPRDNFLSMVTGGSIPCPVKGGSVIEVASWDIPMVWNSNYLPNYTEDSGEITRRIMMVEFEKPVPAEIKDTELDKKIIANEFAIFIHRCCKTYLELTQKHRGKDITTFCPEYFLETREIICEQSNKLFRYLRDNTEYCEQSHITASELRKQFSAWLADTYKLDKIPRNDKKISISTISKVDARYVYQKQMICKFCKDAHKKGCCESYKREARSTFEIINYMRFTTLF